MKSILKLIKYLFYSIIVFTLISIAIGLFFLPSDVETDKVSTKSEKKEKVSKDVKIIKTEKLPDNPKIDIEVNVEEKATIKYIIDTNIPLPIFVTVGLTPNGIKGDDPLFGFEKTILIDKTPFLYSNIIKNVYGVDSRFVQKILPSGEYEADVNFYPNQGGDNVNPLAKKIKNKISASKIVSLQTSGSISEAIRKSKARWWGMDIYYGDEWDKNKFIKHMGEFEELKVKDANPKVIKVYYFKDAHMTFFVSKPLKQVFVIKKEKSDIMDITK